MINRHFPSIFLTFNRKKKKLTRNLPRNVKFSVLRITEERKVDISR